MKMILGIRFTRVSRVLLGIAPLLLFQLVAQAQDAPEPPADAPAEPAAAAKVAIPALSAKHTNAYKSQFDKMVEIGRWSPTMTGEAPNGRKFLGEYSEKAPLVFTLGDLPEHRYLRLRCDLLILKSWDGHSEGPADTFSIMEVGGPLLMMTSFCNPATWKDPTKKPASSRQSYPNEYPFTTHDSGTGSSGEGAALAFKFRDDLNLTDAIYKIDMTFPHTDKDLALRFFGNLNGKILDESWALDKVSIDTVDGESPLDDKQLAALWKKISGKKPVAANDALWRVVAAGPKALASIEAHWKILQSGGVEIENQALVALRAKVEKLIGGLSAESFIDRQLAHRELVKLGDSALVILEEQLKKSKDPERRRGLTAAISRIRKGMIAKQTDSHQVVIASRVAHIRRIFTTRENGYKITSSPTEKAKNVYDSIGAPADGYIPHASNVEGVPRWTWYPNLGSKEWLQYEFKKPKTISVAGVYWFDERSGSGGKCSLPESWRLLYQTPDGKWKPVEPKGDYKIEADKMNQVEFKPVLTGAVRLEAELKEGRSAGVLEFGVSNPKPAK